MNILFIDHYAGAPQYGMAYRTFYLSREWVRQGHSVTIVGATYSHLRHTQPKHGIEYIDGVRYVWLDTPRYRGNGLARVLNMLKFVITLWLSRKKVAKDYGFDIIIASSTYVLDVYPAKYFANYYKAKLVYEVHDLWPLTPMELGGMSKYHPFIMGLQAAENYAYRVSDKIVSLLPKAKTYLQQHGMASNKFVYIPNGINVMDWSNAIQRIPPEHMERLNKLKGKGNFLIGYAGGHSISNALIFLLKAAKMVEHKNITIVLVGQGNEKQYLQEFAQEERINNIVFLSPVVKDAIPDLLSYFDTLYIGWNKVSLYRFGICANKIFDYMMSGVPIVHSVTAGNDFVAEAQCGISVPAEDVTAIADAFVYMQSLSFEERSEMGHKGHDFVMAHHDYRILAKNFYDKIIK